MPRPRRSSCGSLPAPDGVDEESVGGFEVGGDSSLRRTRRRRVRRRLEAEGGVEDAVSENAEIILKTIMVREEKRIIWRRVNAGNRLMITRH